MTAVQRVDMIRQTLTAAFSPERLDIVDDSQKHAGHAGARGGGHFSVYIVAKQFEGKSLLQRHRMVYEALSELMQGEIHALAIRAETPEKTT